MPRISLVYLNLSTAIIDTFSSVSHKVFDHVLNDHFQNWTGFLSKYPAFDLGITISTNADNEPLQVKGPTIFKRLKVIDYSIFIPADTKDLQQYVELICDGIYMATEKYGVTGDEIKKIEKECKERMNMNI